MVYIEKAAELKNADAMYKLGYFYSRGRYVEQDKKKAVEWYKKAAELGSQQAQCNLALCYMNGAGLEKNVDFGIYWLERAVANGSVMAMYNLGKCYEFGLGVEPNAYFALKNYLSAANKGNVDAKLAVVKLYKYEYKDYEQAIYWLNDLIKTDKDEVYIELADIYVSGLGVEVNEYMALTLIEMVKNKDCENYILIKEKIKKCKE